MEKVVWDEKFKIGVEVIDKAHAKLFRIMEKLLEISEDVEGNQHMYKEGIKYFEDYSMTHFAEEEAYMRSIRYNGYAHHKRIHDNFRDKTLVSLKKDLELSGYSTAAIQRLVMTMNRWLTEHIMKEDKAIVGGAAQKGNGLSAQVAVISKTIDRIARDGFQVGAKLVSAEYKGQNIGNGYYCRQFYNVKGGIRVQVLLGVEEPLLIRGFKRMPGVSKDWKGEMTIQTVLPVFGYLFQEVGKLFQAEGMSEINKDSLLAKDAFRADFMKGYPCALLFGTKIGYIIFCYRTWRVKTETTGNKEKR